MSDGSGLASGELSIAICDRCRRKVPYMELRADGDKPGLRVCGRSECYDVKDPWRLPPRQTENISLRFPRLDAPLNVNEGPSFSIWGCIALEAGGGDVELEAYEDWCVDLETAPVIIGGQGDN